jgi:hypothetical protein
MLDGELLMRPDGPSCNINELVRKEELSKEDETAIECLQYHVYDMLDTNDPDLPLYSRVARIWELLSGKEVLKVVEYKDNVEDMDDIRNPLSVIGNRLGVYLPGHKSTDMFEV